MKHKEYNLDFVNLVEQDKYRKTAIQQNSGEDKPLDLFIHVIMALGRWREFESKVIPNIEIHINHGFPYYYGCEVVDVYYVEGNARITYCRSYTQELPIADFKEIMLEWVEFMNTPPLNGSPYSDQNLESTGIS